MLKRTLIATAILFIACDEPGQCVKETPAPESLGLGEPCLVDPLTEETSQPCKPGLWCSGHDPEGHGYCTFLCEQSADCPVLNYVTPVCKSHDGTQRPVCKYYCDLDVGLECPRFAQDLECAVDGLCKVIDPE